MTCLPIPTWAGPHSPVAPTWPGLLGAELSLSVPCLPGSGQAGGAETTLTQRYVRLQGPGPSGFLSGPACGLPPGHSESWPDMQDSHPAGPGEP